MHGSASSLSACKKALDLFVGTLGVLSEDLSSPVSGNTSHIVMDGREDWDGLLGGIDTGEDVSSLKDTWESLMDLLGRQMVQVEVDVIGIGSNTTSLKDLHGHGSGDDVTRGQVLSIGGVSLHEALSFTVSEDTTLTTAAFSHEAASTIDSSWMELNELGVLNGKASSGDHTTTVTGASMGASAGEVGSAIATSGNDSLVGLHPVNGSIGHVIGHDTAALVAIHEQVHGEVLDKEDAVVAEGTTEQGVEHLMTGTVGDSAASVGLTTLSEVGGLTSKGSLVDLSIASSAEGHTVGLELTHGNRSLSGHILDSILVSKPVRTLHGVVEVISPVILVHVAESSIDSALIEEETELET